MAWKKKPRFKAPEGEFERLTQENSIEVAFDAQATLPLDIGIELPDGRMQPIVKRGTKSRLSNIDRNALPAGKPPPGKGQHDHRTRAFA